MSSFDTCIRRSEAAKEHGRAKGTRKGQRNTEGPLKMLFYFFLFWNDADCTSFYEGLSPSFRIKSALLWVLNPSGNPLIGFESMSDHEFMSGAVPP